MSTSIPPLSRVLPLNAAMQLQSAALEGIEKSFGDTMSEKLSKMSCQRLRIKNIDAITKRISNDYPEYFRREA